MTTNIEANLGNFKMRSPSDSDRLILREWLRTDPNDPAICEPEFYFGGGPSAISNPVCAVVENSKGPVLFLRAARAARIYFQAPPTTSAEERARNREALQAALASLEGLLAHVGTEQLVIVSANAAIQSFATTKIGFSPSANTLIKFLQLSKGR